MGKGKRKAARLVTSRLQYQELLGVWQKGAHA